MPTVVTPTIEIEATGSHSVEVDIINGGYIPPVVTSNAGFQVVNGSTTLGGQRLVTVTAAGVLEYADCTNPLHVGRPIGLTTGAVSPLATTFAVIAGFVDEPSWSWTPGDEVFLGENGMPVLYGSLPGNRAFDLPIGSAVSATRLQLNITNIPIVK